MSEVQTNVNPLGGRTDWQAAEGICHPRNYFYGHQFPV